MKRVAQSCKYAFLPPPPSVPTGAEAGAQTGLSAGERKAASQRGDMHLPPRQRGRILEHADLGWGWNRGGRWQGEGTDGEGVQCGGAAPLEDANKPNSPPK